MPLQPYLLLPRSTSCYQFKSYSFFKGKTIKHHGHYLYYKANIHIFILSRPALRSCSRGDRHRHRQSPRRRGTQVPTPNRIVVVSYRFAESRRSRSPTRQGRAPIKGLLQCCTEPVSPSPSPPLLVAGSHLLGNLLFIKSYSSILIHIL